MSVKLLGTLFFGLTCAGIGLLCGWATGGHGEAGQVEVESAAPVEEELVFTERALENMGVRLAPISPESYVRSHSIPAIVAATPQLVQGVYAPVAGRVQTIEAAFGSVVFGGEVLLTLLREPLPRARLELTGDVLKPISENVHQSMADLLRAIVTMEIASAELERLRGLNGDDVNVPLLPKKELIRLEYELLRGEREVAIVRDELLRHGLKKEQIDGIASGKLPDVDFHLWLETLEHNGFWTEAAQRLYGALPEHLRTVPWTVATIGELVAGDLLSEGLILWLEGDSGAAQHFLEIGGLMQRGHSLLDVQDLHLLGALEQTVFVTAPVTAPDWDVMELLVKPGQFVEAGGRLLVLEDARNLYLRAEPAGHEVQMVMDALRGDVNVEARPLLPGTGPSLTGLSILKLFHSDEGGGTVAYLPLENVPLLVRQGEDGRNFRTWSLREGLKYELRLPLNAYDNVYVLPRNAVIDDGVERVVFLRHEDSFDKIPIHVLYEDHEIAVLPVDGHLPPGSPIVVEGAFAVGLAMKGVTAGADDGHGHAH